MPFADVITMTMRELERSKVIQMVVDGMLNGPSPDDRGRFLGATQTTCIEGPPTAESPCLPWRNDQD